jgi:hypothetical protein
MLFEKNYILGSYFFIDIISLFSLFIDNHWIYNSFLKSVEITDITYLKKNLINLNKSYNKIEEGKRIIGHLRILRLTRISKLYKIFIKLSEKRFFSLKEKDPKKENIPKSIDDSEEKVASKFSELILRRVIFLILLMIIGIIFLNPIFYSKPISSMKYGMKIFNFFDRYDTLLFNNTFNLYVNENMVN